MKYSYKWLKELSGTKKNAEEIADLLTFHAFEIEGIEKNGTDFDKVVVGQILEISAHPNADKLQLTKVSVGKEVLEIVCGARNIKVGDKVPVALVGAKLPSGIEIKEAEIRGAKSFGMLCALDELGMGSDHSGIFILGDDLKVGVPFAEALELDDASIEVDVLANRAHDALSHVGMAREIAAVEKRKIDYDYDGLILPKKKTKKLKVSVEDKVVCPRYIGAVLENVKVGDSPQWLRNRLEKSGIRAINNVVDATNFVMLELGQPLHAFDSEKVGKEIIVRLAEEGEEIKILDGSVKKLTKADIVIADKEKAIALAGVMGGLDSGVTEGTTSIIIEAANFDAPSIRRTRMNLALPTDAAIRFEKKIDPSLAEKSMVRVIEILEHISEGELEGICDQYPKKAKPWSVKLDLDYVGKLLGEDISAKRSKEILSLLGMKVNPVKSGIAGAKQFNRVKGSGKTVSVEIPTFRLDLETQEDLIEEIGRIYGYEKIEAVPPLAPVRSPKINEERLFERKLKNILVAEGFSEVYNYSFYGQKDAGVSEFSAIRHVELENSLNADQNLMRVSLFPGLLKNVRENLKNFREFSIFEMGRVYWRNGDILPQEKNMLSGMMVFDMKGEKGRAVEFFEAKGYLDNVLRNIGISDYYYDTFEPQPQDSLLTLWHEGRTAEIKLEGSGKRLGFFGEINPLVLANFDVHTRVVAFEFDVKNLGEVSDAEMEYKPLRKYPTVTRDISLVSQNSMRVDDLLQAIQDLGGDIVLDADLFDMFDFTDGSTSYAFHVMLGADDRTLNGAEIEETMGRITKGLEAEHGMQIRQ